MLKLQIIGNLGQDVKVVTTSDKPFIAFNVAEQSGKGDRVHTTWIECTQGYEHGNGVPKVAEYLKQGKKVYVEGRPYSKIYNGSDGVAKASIGLLVERIELCGSGE